MLRHQIMLQNVEHQILILEKLNVKVVLAPIDLAYEDQGLFISLLDAVLTLDADHNEKIPGLSLSILDHLGNIFVGDLLPLEIVSHDNRVLRQPFGILQFEEHFSFAGALALIGFKLLKSDIHLLLRHIVR